MNSDFVSLVATYNTLISGGKNQISPDLLGRGYSPEQLAQAKKHLAEKFSPVVSCGLRFTKPFDHLKYDLISYVLVLFENYERGILPFPGSVSEQPAQIIEIFSIIRQLKHEAEVKARENSKSNGRNQYKNKPRASR